MDKIKLSELKEQSSRFFSLRNELERAKNKKERDRIGKDLVTHKERMIRDFELRKYDNYIVSSMDDNHWFGVDIDRIVDELEKQNSI